MINVVVPLAGASQYFDEREYKFPKPLMEVNGKTMIENFINNIDRIKGLKQYIFLVNDEDCRKYHLDNVLSLLTNGQEIIVRISAPTQGAACTALMAIGYINNGNPLIIANPDQVIDADLSKAVEELLEVDAGVITFESVHPKWSYVLLGDDDCVIETSEKKPISNNAIAGFYCYSQGKDFVDAAMNMIRKDTRVEGSFYVSLTFNELVLKGKVLKRLEIGAKDYHSFYSPQKIKEYERQGR